MTQREPQHQLGTPLSKIVPFFLPALLFLSVFFSVFSPMPLFAQAFRGRWAVVWGSLVSNIAVVALWGFYGAGGGSAQGAWIASTAVFGAIAVLSVVFLFLVLKARQSPEKAGAIALGTVGLLVGGALAWLVLVRGWSWEAWVGRELQPMLDQLRTSSSEEARTVVDSVDDLKKVVLKQLPSGFLGLGMVLLWANFLMMSRLFGARFYEQARVVQNYFSTWKVSEYFVWPAIAAGALVVFSQGVWAVVGMNFLNVFFVLYGLQGLSCLTFLLDRWKIMGFPRVLIFVLAVWPMSMALVTAGFLDLWFDFRGKLVQSNS